MGREGTIPPTLSMVAGILQGFMEKNLVTMPEAKLKETLDFVQHVVIYWRDGEPLPLSSEQLITEVQDGTTVSLQIESGELPTEATDAEYTETSHSTSTA